MIKKERLDKILSNMGYGSRKDIKKIIKEGRVQVNDKIVKNNSMKIDPYKDKVTLDGIKVDYRKYIYLMLNKPKDVVSSTDDPINRTVLDLIDEEYLIFNPFPAGRLDKDTEGLLLLTNDGKLAHELLSPKKGVDKTYYVEVDGFVEEDHKDQFKDGVLLDDGYKTLPAKLEILESNVFSKVKLTIKEGKFHQVKRMFQAIDMEVIYLKRISMGNLKLDENLNPGEYRELTDEEIILLKEKK
mgnify:CR=1 FL=1